MKINYSLETTLNNIASPISGKGYIFFNFINFDHIKSVNFYKAAITL